MQLCWDGGFAVEVMAMGKPVVAYMREEDFDVIPKAMRQELPIINANPDNIYTVLENAIQQRYLWPVWGQQSQNFVRKWHNPLTIAKAMTAAYASPDNKFELEKIVTGEVCAE